MQRTANLIGKAWKNCNKAPKGVQEIFQVLLAEMIIGGPIRNRWPNYGKITGKKIVITATSKKEDQLM
ncbi:MAG: hypothetical protein B6I22_13955 [Desulfobacteraceae bacterium 4572_123]|nr:MAG: hypothetical protein B6I22_13955 [Desulfobacteraceae bacterium 4572_123]